LPGLAGVTATYTYDARGQRTQMTVTEGGVTTTSTYTYEGLTLLSVATAASDGTTSSVTYLADSSGRPYGGVFASSESTAVAFGIVTTDRGDVRALTDELGAAFAFYAYDAYGNPRDAQTRATSLDATTSAEVAGANVLRYAGYAYDAHAGLYYCSARYYDPATASFITKDPAKADGEESAYQYCGGDPVGKVDPSGEVAVARGGGSKSKWKRTTVKFTSRAWGLGGDGLAGRAAILWPEGFTITVNATISWGLLPTGRLMIGAKVDYWVGVTPGWTGYGEIAVGVGTNSRQPTWLGRVSVQGRRGTAYHARFGVAVVSDRWVSSLVLKASEHGTCALPLHPNGSKTVPSYNPFGTKRPSTPAATRTVPATRASVEPWASAAPPRGILY